MRRWRSRGIVLGDPSEEAIMCEKIMAAVLDHGECHFIDLSGAV